MADGSLTKHGFPRGYRFVPTQLELLSILSQYIETGGALDPPLHGIFHDIRILNYHPEELHERYKDDAEHRYIYFFSERQFQKAGPGVAVPEDKDHKEPRPVRVARGGGWKPSGGGQVLRLPRKKGGFVAGRMVTMVFYDRVAGGGVVKSNWGMHEFVVPVDQEMTSPPTKYTRFHDLALYRLYILKSGDMESDNGAAGSSSQMMPKGYDPYAPSTSVAPCPPLQPSGIFTGNKALAAGASTSHMPPPPPQQQQLPSAQHAQYYHHQHAFVGATAAGAGAQPHVHNMPVLGAGLPGNLRQFAVPPAPAPVPPAPANPAAAHQAPTAAMHGAGQDTGHFGAKCSPSPAPAIESSSAEQHATATEEPAHAQFADCVRPMEAAAPQPPLEDIAPGVKDEGMAVADDYGGIGMPDWNNFDFTPLDDSFPELEFTMEELLGCSMLDESLAPGGLHSRLLNC
uniref:NAC domain-containing protein n=1 Tax=Setaria viridis TaxID=4556 RepID=A0A4U6SY37_SETVI|nr:hypothetical protein SEVIR_9G264300v2 [Setaria viridis]